MEIKISRSITSLYSRIVDSNLNLETRQFVSLNADEKNTILCETYQRIFKAFWNTPTRVTNFKKDSEKKCEEDEQRVLTSIIPVTSKNKSVYYVADLNFEFNPNLRRFKITVTNQNARNKKAREAYTVCLNRELCEIKKDFEEICSPMHFINAFFATLRAHKLTRITGKEAGMIYKIYTKALFHYPLFKKLSYEQRVRIMQKGMKRTFAQRSRNRDIHLYSKATFEILERENLISVLTGMDEFKHTFYLVNKNRKTRRNYENYSEVWEYNALIFLTYQYRVREDEEVTLQISFSAFDLWNILN